ncbi:MAG: helix-turn-helix domain-containing protein [Magnetospirillum gryphiswaldense]|nr:helix-turn-helix domain-containing protein [Magnetospirillum gryphiswaldense]
MRTEAIATLRRHPVFATVPEADLAGLLDAQPGRTIEAGQVLFDQGDDATHLYVLMDGQVELAMNRPGCLPEVLAHLSAGMAVGADSLIPGSRHAATAQCVQAGRVAAIRGDALTAYLDDHFDLMLAMIAEMAGSLHGLVKEITELKLQSTTERLASYLCGLAAGHQGRAVEVKLPFEKRLLAERLGMEPATLSRSFAKLREIGIESGRGDRVLIADLENLRAVVEALDMQWEGDPS